MTQAYGDTGNDLKAKQVGMAMVDVFRFLAVVVVLVALCILLWLAWKIALFLFMAWIMIGVASSAMKGR